LFENISFKFISPEELKMPQKVIDFLDEKNIEYSETIDYKKGITNSDVLYVTRLQKERFTDLTEYERLKNDFILTLDLLKLDIKNITIMHPLPRVNEVEYEVDALPNAAFFRQASNGVAIRMALLYLLLR
jgi:aspartate carbamoyltransferase catalytic subunit